MGRLPGCDLRRARRRGGGTPRHPAAADARPHARAPERPRRHSRRPRRHRRRRRVHVRRARERRDRGTAARARASRSDVAHARRGRAESSSPELGRRREPERGPRDHLAADARGSREQRRCEASGLPRNGRDRSAHLTEQQRVTLDRATGSTTSSGPRYRVGCTNSIFLQITGFGKRLSLCTPRPKTPFRL
jgi:hypothetical protein